jgi:anti-sigma factor RsiW
MTALSKRMPEQEPSEIETLLPWHAAGTLSARDARRVEEELARDPELARQYAVIREEYAETIALNESLGAPSVRAMQKLFAAIDAEPARSKTDASPSRSSRIAGFFADLSPRALAWLASAAAVVLVLQAAAIGAFLIKNHSTTYQTASLSLNEPNINAPVTRALGPQQEAPPRALVRFKPEARMSDITALLDTYQATIIGGGQGGMFRLQFNGGAMTKDEAARLIDRLQNEKIVGLAVASP